MVGNRERAKRRIPNYENGGNARKQKEPSLRAPQLVKEIEAKFGVTLTDGHVNYLLRKRG